MKDIDELEAIIAGDMMSTQGFDGDTISSERAGALHYYEGEPFGNEQDGRSQVISRDVLETIEWIMPNLLRAFADGDTVKFIPEGPEDIEFAETATDYVNYIWSKDNPGFLTYYSWFKDALLMKNGYVKVWWDESDKVKVYMLEGLNDNDFQMMVADKQTEVLEHSEYPGVMGMMHDLKIRVTEIQGRVKVQCIPTEHFLIDRHARSLDEAAFMGHRELRTKSDLIKDGYAKEFVEDLPGVSSSSAQYDTEEEWERFDNDHATYDTESMERQNQNVWVTEWYGKIDMDDDGIAEPLKITVAGGRDGVTVLQRDGEPDIEDWDGVPPFADLAPIIMPHRHLGVSMADLVMDIQEIKSAIFRQSLDGMYHSNTPVVYVNENSKVNLDDLLTRRPGGIVRGRGPASEAIQTLHQPFDLNNALGMMEYVDQIREVRTGIGEVSAGLDADVLQNQTAMAASLGNAAKNARVELITRLFAETGVKKVFKLILQTVIKHQDEARMVKFNEEFTQIDPRYWNADMDLTINVGLGTGNNDRKMGHLAAVLNYQEKLMAADPAGGLGIVKPENVYRSLVEVAKAAQLQNPEQYFTDPTKAAQMGQQQEKQDPEAQAAQAEMQMKGQVAQAEMQMKAQAMQAEMQMKQQASQQAAQVKMQEASQKAQLEQARARAQLDLEREKASNIIDLEREKAGIQLQLERDKAQAQMQLKEQEMAAEIELEKYKVAHDLPGGQGNVPEVE
jgi:hypothetical protein